MPFPALKSVILRRLMNIFFHIGRYYQLLTKVFSKPEKMAIYRNRFFSEVNSLGIGSLGIIAIISIFMGAVITIQAAFGFESPWIPLYAVGLASRDSIILEFSPAIVSLILAGKVGSNIAGEIGTMRVTEQIDAMEIMGVNSAAYLILPKIVAFVFILPFLIIISMFLAMIGGLVFGTLTHAVTPHQYLYGIQYDFRPYNVTYALIKTLVFAFIITSVSSYHGYYTNGGAREVGRSSTKAVVYGSVVLLFFDLLLTQLLLA
jgi:phospholipid/cholesterol/gamma-HCH transport system permease protein